jgi:hypothetical protein
MSSSNQQKNRIRAATAAKVEKLMRRAEADAIARERARWRVIYAPGNSYIAYVGNRDHCTESSMPSHFLTDENSLWVKVNSLYAGFALVELNATECLTAPTIIESTMPNWPTLIVDKLNSGERRFQTSNDSIRQLIEAASGRMGLTVEVAHIS